MYNKDISDMNCFPTGMEQQQQRTNEPEEGEIVDDYELISSDEELCMRQRIRELEEENAEIEQIAVISRSYDIDRAARIPTDVSSISSTEFKTPKKRKRHKNKEHKKKTCHHHHSHSTAHHRHHTGGGNAHVEKRATRSRKTRCKRREKLLSKKQQRMSYKEVRDNINIDSSDSMKSSLSSLSLSDSDCSTRNISAEDMRDDNDYYHRSEIRDTLRLAVARSRKNSTRQSGHNVDLKERLLRKDLEFTGNQFSNTTNIKNFPNNHHLKEEEENVQDDDEDDDDVVICEPEPDIQCVPDDSSDSLEEKELRLIALKSAVLKKHMDRKKRNAEAAYSPTDFDEIISSCVVDSEDKLADLEVVDLDDDDSQMGCATASPIASPQLMILEGQEDSSQMMDCKPVDMDIANSDSEDCPPAPPAVINWNNEMASNIPYPPYPPADFHSGPYPPYGLYMPEFNAASLNPPPPGVDDYDEMKHQITSQFEGKNHNIGAQDMDVENEEFEPIETYPTTTNKNVESSPIEHELKLNSNTVSLQSNPMDEETQEEEEEQALRALLLAKFNSPKNQKKNNNQQAPSTLDEEKENPKHSEESKITVKPTEAILKEAVKRLKVVGSFKEDNRYEDQLGANVSPTMWNAKTQNDSIEEIPLPPRIHMSLESNICSNDYSNINSITVQCLKRKVEEFKNYKDSDIQGENYSEHNSGYNSPEIPNEIIGRIPQISNTKIIQQENLRISSPIETNCHEIRENTIPNLDEDTKRRLQKLKDEILNATVGKQIEPLVENNMENKAFNECNTNFNNTPIIDTDIKEAALNKNDIITPKLNEDCLPDKTINDLDNKTNTLLNSSNTKALMEITKPNSALRENNLNKNNKSLDIVTNNLKTAQDPKKVVVRTVNKTLVSIKNKIIKNPSTIKNMIQSNSTPNSLIKPIPTYSVLRTTKIVKPNKVINTNVDLKRKVVLIKSNDPPAPPKPLAATGNKVLKNNSPAKANPTPATAPLSVVASKPPADNTRLITSIDQVRHMCNVAQLVISVQNSSNESSADEWPDCDSMYKPVYEYNDISSPLSLNLESPCLTPTRSNSPAEEMDSKNNPALKSKRSPIVYKKEEIGATVEPKTPVITKPPKTAVQQMGATPVAVRHLPSAAQDEYRKLVNRMKLLENQRSKKDSSQSNMQSSSSSLNKIENDTPAVVKSTLVKQVLLRNTSNNKSTGEKKTQETTAASSVVKPHKASVLRTYESLYAKIGAGIVNNLDKSLNLVDEAKKAKISKLKLETRLKKLKAEMEFLQSLHKEEEQKISRIYPNICSTNEVITSMKQKRSKVFKAALNLGKTLKGEDYRLNNELKQSITNKSKKLASEIKMINSLKAEDIDRLLMEENNANKNKNSSPMDDQLSGDENIPLSKLSKIYKKPAQTESLETTPGICKDKNEKIEEDKIKTTKNPNKLESVEESFKNDLNTVICSETIIENHPQGDPPICETIFPAETGVNTEFQDKEMPSSEEENTECKNPKEGSFEEKEDEIQECTEAEDVIHGANETDSKGLLSYTSPLDHLRNMNGSMDPNGVICPYDLMGNCEDTSCKYVHISQHEKMDKDLKKSKAKV